MKNLLLPSSLSVILILLQAIALPLRSFSAPTLGPRGTSSSTPVLHLIIPGHCQLFINIVPQMNPFFCIVSAFTPGQVFIISDVINTVSGDSLRHA